MNEQTFWLEQSVFIFQQKRTKSHVSKIQKRSIDHDISLYSFLSGPVLVFACHIDIVRLSKIMSKIRSLSCCGQCHKNKRKYHQI